ncbi:hypothetical protein ACFFK0_22365 [Paenibacillus chartarius]|uniref:CoF synthetase n=1 Tax=Paenibacillus chartarius TaxID=747481 RepID=A0ABV6DR68_9BACL
MIHPPPPQLQRKIRETVRVFPWYGGLLPAGKMDSIAPSQLTLDDLPLMTAPLLEKHYYASPPRSDTDGPLSVYRTSGTSTGIRKSIYYSEEDDRHYIDIRTRLYGDWLQCTANSLQRALADMGTGHAASTAVTIFERLGLTTESLSYELPVARHIERLEAFRPDVLYTMPSILDRIVHAASDPARFGIRKIILVGEIATPAWQRGIASAFGIAPEDILDTFGSIEIGTIAAYSHAHGKYLLAEGLHAEGIAPERLEEGFEPLADNEQVLVLTSWVRSYFPALRFVTYDVVRDLQTIEVDGTPRQAFTCIAKRIGPELKHGEKISIYDIEAVVAAQLPDAQTRVQLRDNRLTVLLRSSSLESAMLPAIRTAIEHKIPEIGSMIGSGILESIEVRAADEGHEAFARPTGKSKKLHY